MKVTGIVANIAVADIEAARGFYTEFLGLNVEAFNLGSVAHYQSPEGNVHIQLVSGDATSPVNSDLSLHVGDGIDAAYAEARERGYEIVYPLTLESWGIRRFFVRAPDGTVVNVTSHSD